MPRYNVDVKVFFNVPIEADDERGARRAANQFIEAVMSACPATVSGYNMGVARHDPSLTVIESEIEASIDGESDVELEEE